jgi:hypothetical protein
MTLENKLRHSDVLDHLRVTIFITPVLGLPTKIGDGSGVDPVGPRNSADLQVAEPTTLAKALAAPFWTVDRDPRCRRLLGEAPGLKGADYLKALPKLLDMGRLTEPFAFVGISVQGNMDDWSMMRYRDFTPARPTDDYSKRHTYAKVLDITGGTGRFVTFLKDELIPHIESAYPVDPSRREGSSGIRSAACWGPTS